MLERITITIIMTNDDNIKIETDIDVEIDDKIKAWAKILCKKMEEFW